jgi:Ca2+-binding RTX toxin-like protein
MVDTSFSRLSQSAPFGGANQTGSGDDDNLQGTNNNDVLKGQGGNDQLFGYEGNDRLLGGDGNDFLAGGDGDDYLNPGDNSNYDTVDAGLGNDTVDLSNLTLGASYVTLNHQSFFGLTQGVAVTIDGSTNTASVDKGGVSGTTTIVNVSNALSIVDKNGKPGTNGGFGVNGTEFGDSFHVNPGDNGWLQIRGEDGADSYQIDAHTGYVRLDFVSGTGAVKVNLSRGIVFNDGFGNRETITGTGATTELRSTMMNDNITGSNNDERFILMAGTDVLDGRGGNDMSRYDRYGVDSVSVDLETGTATGVWQAQAFTHTLKNIESLRGSRFGDDTLRGTDDNNEILGRGGDDTLVGRGGKDFLNGEDGDDVLDGGAGNDTLIGDGVANYFYLPGSVNDGRDNLIGGKGNDLLNGGGNADVLNGGAGVDTASYENATTGVRVDLINAAKNTGEAAGDVFSSVENLLGSNKNDRLSGTNGKNKIDGGKGNDRLDGQGGNDNLIGGKGDDRLDGGKGNDRHTGGDGNDTFIFSDGKDVITDFNTASNREKVDLSDVTSIVGFNDLINNHVTEVNGNLVIDDLGGNTLKLLGVSIADLDKGDFVF